MQNNTHIHPNPRHATTRLQIRNPQPNRQQTLRPQNNAKPLPLQIPPQNTLKPQTPSPNNQKPRSHLAPRRTPTRRQNNSKLPHKQLRHPTNLPQLHPTAKQLGPLQQTNNRHRRRQIPRQQLPQKQPQPTTLKEKLTHLETNPRAPKRHGKKRPTRRNPTPNQPTIAL